MDAQLKTSGNAGLSDGFVRVRGAREHNLKDLSLEIPRNALVVFTGGSGSGKSSLAFGTLYAEQGTFTGVRRYVLQTFATTQSAMMKRRVARFLSSCCIKSGRPVPRRLAPHRDDPVRVPHDIQLVLDHE
jgi:hypothetical protein